MLTFGWALAVFYALYAGEMGLCSFLGRLQQLCERSASCWPRFVQQQSMSLASAATHLSCRSAPVCTAAAMLVSIVFAPFSWQVSLGAAVCT